MKILPIEDHDKETIKHIITLSFEEFFNDEKLKKEIDLHIGILDYSGFNNLDRKIVVEDHIVGFYLIDEENIFDIIDLNKYENYKEKKGLKGVIMGIIPEHRNKGYGKLLVEYSKTIKGFDYIWGGNYKKLNTSNFWLKHRDYLDEDECNIYTIMDLNNK